MFPARNQVIVGMCLAGALLLGAAPALESQETRGMIFGRVMDPQGSAAPGVEVLITNVDTNVTQRTVTNQTGYYEVPYLLPGNYQVTAELAGFKKFVRSGITLSVGSRAEVSIQLELGTVAESISVTADAPLLDTSSASSGHVIDNRLVMDMPVFGNSAILIIKMTPGLQGGGVNNYLGLHSNIGGSDYFTPGNIGGNEWSIDGVPNTGNSRRVAYLPYSDTIQEFKVETSSFDASVGHTTGANIVMLSKSGTNQFHGTLTEQHWQQRWNGTPWRTNMLYWGRIREAELRGDTALAKKLRSEPSQPTGRSNNYAATIGGPVILPKVYNGKDRLFFFFSFNGFRDAKPEEANNINRTVPTMKQRQGDFSELLAFDPVRYSVYDPLTTRADPARAGHVIRTPFPGNIIPESRRNLNPMYAAYTKIYPVPNDNSNAEGRDNYRAIGTPFNWNYKAFSNRVDYQIAPNHKIFGRWSWNDFLEDRGDWTYETVRGLHTNGLNRHNIGATVDYVWTVNPRTVWNFAVAANEFREGDKVTVPFQFKAADVGLPAYIDQRAGPNTILPFLDFPDNTYRDISRGVPGFTRYRMLAGKSDVSSVRGSHTFTAGVDVRQHFRTGGSPGNSTGSFSFNNFYTRRADDTAAGPAGDLGLSWAAFMLGIPSGMSISTNDSYATHNPYYAWFVQDNWRATPRLSFTLGLRWEYEGGFTERYNRMIGGFDPNTRLPISDAAQAAYAANPLPERPASTLVIRGGSLYVGSGAPRHLNQGELLWLPRIGVSYQLNSKTVLRGGYGQFFDTNNVLNDGPNQFGFSRGTSTTISTDFGQTWLAGNPPAGLSPLRDPFPVRPDGTRFNEPTRDKLGLMARVGRGFNPYSDFHWRHTRQQRWRFGVQRQLGTNMMLEAAYAGMYADRISLTKRLDFLPEQYWADGLVRNSALASDLNRNVPNPFNIRNFAFLQTADPLLYQDMQTQGFFTSSTIRKHQLLRDFPHMNDVRNERVPSGKARSHALEVSFEKRLGHGISANAGYTRLFIEEADFYLNEFDQQATWRPSNDGRPHRLTVASIWELPFGKSKAFFKSGVLGAVLGGWQISTAVQYQPGGLLGWGNLFYYGDVQNIVRQGSERMLDQWFNARCATDQNPAGFECRSSRVPDSFHRRIFPTRINGLRSDSTKQVDMNILRNFKVKERWNMQFRVDMINMPNHPQFSGPSTDPLSSNFGKVTSQSAATNRWIQLQFRLRF